MKITTRKLVLNALMIALVFIITYLPFLHIPSPIAQGYFNIGDAAIMVAALMLGKRSGFLAGAFGSALADLLYGAFIFVPITFIVKGLEGYITGAIAARKNDDTPGHGRKVLAVLVGALVMAAGYFIFESIVIRQLDKTLAMTAIIAELPGNLVQGIVSAIVAYVFVAVLEKTSITKRV